MQLHGVPSVLGLDVRSAGSPAIHLVYYCADIRLYRIDAGPNFPNATIFNDCPKSGFGGWGDPANDYQITTGAFAKDFENVYPIPHRVRREYTAKSGGGDFFGDGTPSAPDDLWSSFTPASRDALVQGYAGDFEGFQAKFQGTAVSLNPLIDMRKGGHTVRRLVDAIGSAR